MNRWMMVTAAGLCLAACSKTDPAPVQDRGAAASLPATATPGTPAAAAAGTAIPTPEDYEATVAKTVTADTLDAQLNQLEKDISATPK